MLQAVRTLVGNEKKEVSTWINFHPKMHPSVYACLWLCYLKKKKTKQILN